MSVKAELQKTGYCIEKRKYERKSARLADGDYPVYIYMVRELNDFDRNNMSNEIKNTVLMETAPVSLEECKGGENLF